MVDLKEIRAQLETLASPIPYKNSTLHLGMADNKEAVEIEYGQMLMGAVLAKRPDVVVELGTGPGYSACWFLLAMEELHKGHLYTVDVTPADQPLWRKMGLPEDRITYLSNETTESAAKLIPEKIDLLFHDAAHVWDVIEKDFERYLPMINRGGTLIIHDVNLYREMGDLVARYFDARPDDWKYEEVSSGCGVGIATRIAAPVVKKTPRRKSAGKSKVVQRSKRVRIHPGSGRRRLLRPLQRSDGRGPSDVGGGPGSGVRPTDADAGEGPESGAD